MDKTQTANNKLIEKCASQVPTNWVDSLLTGQKGIGQPPYNCQHIEMLLRGVRDKIRALKVKP